MSASDIGLNLRQRLNALNDIASPNRVETILGALYARIFGKEFAYASGATPELLVQALPTIEAMEALVPTTLSACVAQWEQLKANEIERIVTMICLLKKNEFESTWIHYRLADALNKLMLAGHTLARTPCVYHSLQTIVNCVPGGDAEGLPRYILARELGESSPRDAILNGVQALHLGIGTAQHVVRVAAINLRVPVEGLWNDPMPHQLESIKRALSISSPNKLKIINLPLCDGMRTEVLTEAEEISLPSPLGDKSYYLFKEEQRRLNLPAICVHKIEGGVISFDVSRVGRTQFYVFDKNKRCISELSYGVSPFISDNLMSIKGRAAVIEDKFAGSFNVCHLILDWITRIYLYKAHHEQDIKIISNDASVYLTEIAHLGGFGPSILQMRARQYSLQFDELLISSNVTEDFRHPAHGGSRWALQFLRSQLAIQTSESKARKIFISRKDGKIRNIVNNDEIEGLMKDFGYEIITLSGLSASEQIGIFRSATHVVGVHGAGLTSLVFCPENARILEIFPPLVASPAYWTVASRLGFRYYAFVADDAEFERPDYRNWAHRPEFNDRNIIVSKSALARALDEFEDG